MDQDKSPNREMWLEYINKLNDRALNRQRISGFTTWAVTGIIAILTVNVIRNLTTITTDLNTATLHLTALTGMVNLLFFASVALMLLSARGNKSAEARLQSRLDRVSIPIVFVSLSVAFVFFSVANFTTRIVNPPCLKDWPFLAIGIFFAINALAYPASKFRSWFKHKKHFRDLPEISTRPFPQNPKLQKIFDVSAFIMPIAGLYISAIPVVQSIPYIKSPIHVDTLITSTYIAAIIFLCLFLSFRIASSHYSAFLTELERRIILENLTPEEIRTEFVKGYLGEHIRDWLKQAEQELKSLHDEYEKAASSSEEQFTELSKIDCNMKYEIAGRRKTICKMLTSALGKYTEYSEKLQQQIEHLSDQHALTPELSKQVLAEWRRQLESIKPRQKAVCAICTTATKDCCEKDG